MTKPYLLTIIIALVLLSLALLVERHNDRRCLRIIGSMTVHKVEGETIAMEDLMFAEKHLEGVN
jgi:hypothetical protein